MTVDQLIVSAGHFLGLEAGDVAAGGVHGDAFLRYLNTALRELERVRDWDWLYAEGTVATVAGGRYADLPADFEALRVNSRPYYLDDQDWMLDLVDAGFMNRARAGGLVVSERPRYYAFDWSPADARWRLDLWPTPDGVLSIHIDYRRKLPALTERDQTPALPDRLMPLLETLLHCSAEELHERVERGSQRSRYETALAAEFALGQRSRGHQRLRLGGRRAESFPDPERGDIIVGQITSVTD